MSRLGYDGVVAALPVTMPYERYSTHAAHWWLGRALGALIRQSGLAKTDVDGLCVSSFTLAPDTAVGLVQRLDPVARLAHLEAVALQQVAHHLPEGVLVVHQQHVHPAAAVRRGRRGRRLVLQQVEGGGEVHLGGVLLRGVPGPVVDQRLSVYKHANAIVGTGNETPAAGRWSRR